MNYDRIILELLQRVSVLEEELKAIKEMVTAKPISVTDEKDEIIYARKDTTKYIMDGKRYGKSRLALAIVKKYVLQHPGITAKQLMSVFDKSIQGSLGVVRTIADAKETYADSDRRFFMKADEIIHTATDDCVVCTQWGIFNIDYLIARAEELNIRVVKV